MRQALIDTDVLSLFLRGEPRVVARVRGYLQEHGRLSFSVLTYYEVVSGLRHRDARRQLPAFLELAGASEVVPLGREAAAEAAERYAELRKRGEPIDDVDLLIASTALVRGDCLATRNRRHFDRVRGLSVEDWVGEEVPEDP